MGIDTAVGAPSQSSESSASTSDASSTASPVPKRRKAGSCVEARPTPCCSCPRTQTCTLRSNCACLRAGRACSSCDPATCRKCRNTEEKRNVLKKAEEERDRYERERELKAKNKLINSLGATPLRGKESPTDQSSDHTDPTSSGLGASPADGDSKPPAETPPTDSSTAAPQSSQDSEETEPPAEPKETTQQQQRAENGDSTTGGGTGDRAAAKPATSQPTDGTAEASFS
jgi:hypothetical protein